MTRHICPVCKNPLKEKFDWKGILFAILCFPCGIFCCIRRRRLRCKQCEHEVYIADGSIPTIVSAYKEFGNFKWQFSKKKTTPVVNSMPQVPETHYGTNPTPSNANGTVPTSNQNQAEAAV
uniref:Membrane protein BRI3 n=1 Tax=Panagrolaimus sp. JU765 TaxID=591449 RepID=A0AC34RRD0_9BILA